MKARIIPEGRAIHKAKVIHRGRAIHQDQSNLIAPPFMVGAMYKNTRALAQDIYSIVAITFNSMAIGVGKLFTSTVVLQACTEVKYSP